MRVNRKKYISLNTWMGYSKEVPLDPEKDPMEDYPVESFLVDDDTALRREGTMEHAVDPDRGAAFDRDRPGAHTAYRNGTDMNRLYSP